MEHLVNGLYTQFVLRDFLGRVVPGAVFLIIVALAVASPAEISAAADRATAGHWALAGGAAWVVANALHWVQERAHDLCSWVFRAAGTAAGRRGERLAKVARFARAATPYDLARRERFVVLRHATGTTGAALLVGALAYFLLADPAARDAVLARRGWLAAGAVAAVVLIATAKQEHRDQEQFTEAVVALGPAPAATPATSAPAQQQVVPAATVAAPIPAAVAAPPPPSAHP